MSYDQILKVRVSHMIKFIRLKTDEYNHNGDQILKARVNHIIQFIRLKTDKYNYNEISNTIEINQ